jgi:hypothetical protein
MFQTSYHSLLCVTYRNNQDQTPSSNLLNIPNGALKPSVGHSLRLPRVNVNYHSIADLILSQKSTKG